MRTVFLSPLVAVAVLVSCKQEAPEPLQRISLEDTRSPVDAPIPSPDTTNAVWRVMPDGQAISYGIEVDAPLLTLACKVKDDPPTLTVMRHVPARPGLTALFPVIGNAMISRLPLDAKLEAGEWGWQGTFPAADTRLDVFAGPRDVEATLPGGGTLAIAGSTIPGQFLAWCRAAGNVPQPVNEPGADISAQPSR